MLYYVRRVLSYHAYKFTNGPWRHLWTKRGVDPRTNLFYRQHQIIEWRMPKQWCVANADTVEPTHSVEM